MGIARSTYYESPKKPVDDTSIVESMFAICDEFEFYGYRRIGAALRQQALIINHKKIRRRRWLNMLSSVSTLALRFTFVFLKAPGSAAVTKTHTACYASTFQKERTSASMGPMNSVPPRMVSTADHARR